MSIDKLWDTKRYIIGLDKHYTAYFIRFCVCILWEYFLIEEAKR